MAKISIWRFEKIMQAYLDTLNNGAVQDYHGTQREIGAKFLNGFFSFVKKENAVEDAIELLEANSFTVERHG